jgi:cation diffusion facilitator family transporter
VSPQRRTALLSVAAAVALIALKLGTGLATHSLGLLSEAAHSGTDLVAALLTFFAVGVAARPADVGHQYGHGKAEHLSALAEGSVLVLASLVIVYESIRRLAGSVHPHVDARWYALLVIGVVIVIDVSRVAVSWPGGIHPPRSHRTRCTSRATSAARPPCSSASCSCGRATGRRTPSRP